MNLDKVSCFYLGSIAYETCLRLQEEEKTRVLSGNSAGSIFLLEHSPPVITLGRHAGLENLRVSREFLDSHGYQLVSSSRGGDITVHETGQLVIYYVLPVQSKDAGSFISGIAQPIVSILNDFYKCEIYFDNKRPGFWHQYGKMGFTGFDLTGNVSMHGISLNICNSLEGFSLVVPCGMRDIALTTLNRASNLSLSVEDVARTVMSLYS